MSRYAPSRSAPLSSFRNVFPKPVEPRMFGKIRVIPSSWT